MKLNLVADYSVGESKISAAFTIDASKNLMGLPRMTTLAFPRADGTFAHVEPVFLLMCESGRKASAVCAAWNEGYRKAGLLYDYKPINRKESEVAK